VAKPIEGDPILGIERDSLAKILDRGLWPVATELEQSDLAVQLRDVRKGIHGHELTVRCDGVIRVASPKAVYAPVARGESARASRNAAAAAS
jgi:hypothetical protein